jgi:hypothetical protein
MKQYNDDPAPINILLVTILICIILLLITSAVHAQTLDPNPDLVRCPTINPQYLAQLHKANSWYDDIRQKYGSAIGAHYKWLECNAAAVDSWQIHGSNIIPQDYFAQLGYDSPLGVIHDHTVTKPMRLKCVKIDISIDCSAAEAWSGRGTFGGVAGEDGKIHGQVLFNALFYDGMIDDSNCKEDCTVSFDRPGELRNTHEYPFYVVGVDQQPFYTWWTGQSCGQQCSPARP